MLFAGLGAVDAYPFAVADVIEHLENRSVASVPGILNIHWTTPILQYATGPFRAAIELDRFSAALHKFRTAGGRLVWTLHNVLPHEARHVWAETQLAQLLADRADAIHALSEITARQASEVLRLDPRRVVVIEHSSYVGQYPDWISRDAARQPARTVGPPTRCWSRWAASAPTRGWAGCSTSSTSWPRRTPASHLLVAGKPAATQETAGLERRCEQSSRVISEFSHVPDDQLQVWFGAADLAVLPYSRILNSGVFWLAQSFGLPIVGPRTGALLDLADEPHVTPVQPPRRPVAQGDAALDDHRARRRSASVRSAAHAASLSAARSRPPHRMAEDFAAFIEPMLTGQDRAPRGPLDGPRGDRVIEPPMSSAARHSARDLVASGLLDLDWIGAQLGTQPATAEDAARAVINTPDISPHPLFEATWLPGKGVWQAGDLPPSLWYVTEGPRRNRLAPHPLINTERILEENPAARDHEFGPLAWWSDHATRETPMPVRRGYPHLQWGEFRDNALRAAREWQVLSYLDANPGAHQHSPDAAGPVVTVLMSAQDVGPLLAPTIAALQDQTLDQWELLVLDRGSIDATSTRRHRGRHPRPSRPGRARLPHPARAAPSTAASSVPAASSWRSSSPVTTGIRSSWRAGSACSAPATGPPSTPSPGRTRASPASSSRRPSSTWGRRWYAARRSTRSAPSTRASRRRPSPPSSTGSAAR